MKNYLINMVMLVMSLSLVGCVGEDSAANTTTKTSTPPPVDAPTPSPVDAPTPPPAAAPTPSPVYAPTPPPAAAPAPPPAAAPAPPPADAPAPPPADAPTPPPADAPTPPPADAPAPPPADAPTPPPADAPTPPPAAAPTPPPVDVPISGSASLSWSTPVTRTDDSRLFSMAEIAGYRIYMGSSAANFALLTDIANVHITEYKIDNLGEGTYYFAVSTYSIENIESDVSQIVSKTI